MNDLSLYKNSLYPHNTLVNFFQVCSSGVDHNSPVMLTKDRPYSIISKIHSGGINSVP